MKIKQFFRFFHFFIWNQISDEIQINEYFYQVGTNRLTKGPFLIPVFGFWKPKHFTIFGVNFERKHLFLESNLCFFKQKITLNNYKKRK
jgi:hypothetical protein